MITVTLCAWAFRYRSPLIDEALRMNLRNGVQVAFRYYYVED